MLVFWTSLVSFSCLAVPSGTESREERPIVAMRMHQRQDVSRDLARCGPEGCCCARIHHAVIAALNTGVMLVARDQQESMIVAVRQHSAGGDLPALVDVISVRYLRPRARRNK